MLNAGLYPVVNTGYVSLCTGTFGQGGIKAWGLFRPHWLRQWISVVAYGNIHFQRYLVPVGPRTPDL